MISLGKNIRQANDPLTKVNLETVYHKIRSPHQKLINFIDQLRTVSTIDAKKYRQLKVKLPYLVAGVFNPNFRKKDNFAYTNYFILDIDHINEKDLELNSIFDKIIHDKRVCLAFRSPSNDGIKIFFKLSEKCYDGGKYTLFYKHFAHKFSNQYSLSQVIDKTTSDVSRACFVSYDPQVYYNKQADAININNEIDFENEEFISEINFDIKKSEKAIADKNIEQLKNELDFDRQDLPTDILQKIREKLNPKIKEKRERNVFVPEQLDEILEDITKAMQDFGIKTESIKNINYGKQFKFSIRHIWSEINVFYGKKGFTLVKTAKNGSNQELADTCYDILYNTLYNYE